MSAPPPEIATTEWPLGAAYGLSIDDGRSIADVPESMQPYFPIVDGVVPMEGSSRASSSMAVTH